MDMLCQLVAIAHPYEIKMTIIMFLLVLKRGDNHFCKGGGGGVKNQTYVASILKYDIWPLWQQAKIYDLSNSNNCSLLCDKDCEKLNYEEVAAHYLYLKLWEKAVIWTIMWIVANVRAFMGARLRFMTFEDTNENCWMTRNGRLVAINPNFLGGKFSGDQFLKRM